MISRTPASVSRVLARSVATIALAVAALASFGAQASAEIVDQGSEVRFEQTHPRPHDPYGMGGGYGSRNYPGPPIDFWPSPWSMFDPGPWRPGFDGWAPRSYRCSGSFGSC
ncbi:hypothetical protein [Nocardia yamanashiensis]|uniref:hypothetical protein n=1 Tax=Nocardia yamanashiensis TaxID=209247 RepID=UPI00082D181D|nr:hypothetical protein [Nocardia yamanashiensis]